MLQIAPMPSSSTVPYCIYKRDLLSSAWGCYKQTYCHLHGVVIQAKELKMGKRRSKPPQGFLLYSAKYTQFDVVFGPNVFTGM
jgi:hypothetical protein